MWSRRQFIQLAACTLTLACSKRRAAPVRRSRGPRHVVIAHLDGGIDPILTTDPKKRGQVATGVDAPVEEIVQAGGLALGPHLAAFAPFASRMAIVNGVHLDTANHFSGWAQISRLRTNVVPQMPAILDLIGEYGDQPLAAISFGSLAPPQYTAGYADGSHVFDFHRSSHEQLASVHQTFEARARSLAKIAPDPRGQHTADTYRRIGRLAEALEKVPVFEPQDWNVYDKRLAEQLQRLLWALEHDLTRCAFVKVQPYSGWDSHTNNFIQQRNCSRAFTEVFSRFLQELQKRALIDNTMVIAGSEIGRFPLLNGSAGKDHYPECPFMLFGAGVKTNATYGATDERMTAVPIDLATGKRAPRGGHKVRLDDVGASVLAAVGIEPDACGYEGKVLPFLVERA